MIRPTTAIRPAAAPRLVTLLALLAFFFQSFAVQTHVHHLPLAGTGVAQASNVAPAGPLNSQDPGDPANCPLCQELAHAGTYITPAQVPLLAVLSVMAPAPATPLLRAAVSAPGFAWQSRAPPIH